MKRIGNPLILSLPLLLISCGGSAREQLYSFQMGKQSGAHMIASMTLRQEDYIADKQVLGKKMTFYIEAKMGKPSSQASTLFSEDSLSSEAISSASEGTSTVSSSASSNPDFEDLIMEVLSEGLTVHGWYSIKETLADGRQRMPIGFDIGSVFPEAGETYNLGPDVIEKLIFCETDGKTIYLSIPVSMNDVFFQLYWYGMDIINFEETTEHEINTHPTEADIAEINKTFPATHGGTVYRDFHCISLGLKKQ